MPKKANAVTYQALMGQVEKLKQQAVRIHQEQVKTVVSEIHQQMKRYNLSPKDLQLGSTPKASTSTALNSQKIRLRKKLKPQFKDPISGATWTGRGRTPKWITSAQGKTKQDFAITH